MADAETTIGGIINSAQQYAQDSVTKANSLTDEAQGVLSGFASIGNIPSVEEVAPAPDLAFSESEPDRSIELTIPANRPEAPDLATIQVPDLKNLPDDPPELDLDGLFKQTAPGEIAEFTGTAPTFEDLTAPEAPSISDVAEPDLEDLETPSAPSITMPEFTAGAPEQPPAFDKDIRAEAEALYEGMVEEAKSWVDSQYKAFLEQFYPGAEEQLQTLMDRLNQHLEGGTGLPEDVEQGIYDRARTRSRNEAQQTTDQAWHEAARRGFSMPPGFLLDQARRAQQAAADRNAETAQEIARQQAELEQKNLQFAISTAVEMQTAVRNAALQYVQTLLQVNGQALQYAQQIVSNMVEAYNLSVQQFRAELERYTTEIQLFDAKIRGEQAKIEEFRADVEFEQAKAQLNQAKVDQMGQEIQARTNRVQLYAEKMRAMTTQLEQQKLELDKFRGEIEAYATEVQAKQAEFTAYEAAIRGDRAKMEGEVAKVDAYRAQVDAVNAQNQSKIQAENTKAQANQSIVDRFRADNEAWRTELQAEQARFEGDDQAWQAQMRAYQARVELEIQKHQAELETWRQQNENARVNTQTQAEIQVQQARLLAENTRATADVAVQGSQVQAGIAQAAVSAQNTMVQLASETITQQ